MMTDEQNVNFENVLLSNLAVGDEGTFIEYYAGSSNGRKSIVSGKVQLMNILTTNPCDD